MQFVKIKCKKWYFILKNYNIAVYTDWHRVNIATFHSYFGQYLTIRCRKHAEMAIKMLFYRW